MFEWIIIITVTLAACAATPSKGSRTAGRSRAARGRQRGRTVTLRAQRVAPRRSACNVIDPAQIEAMEAQINAACELGIALDSRSRSERDAVKRARLAQQSANAYARAARIQAQIDRLMLTA